MSILHARAAPRNPVRRRIQFVVEKEAMARSFNPDTHGRLQDETVRCCAAEVRFDSCVGHQLQVVYSKWLTSPNRLIDRTVDCFQLNWNRRGGSRRRLSASSCLSHSPLRFQLAKVRFAKSLLVRGIARNDEIAASVRARFHCETIVSRSFRDRLVTYS